MVEAIIKAYHNVDVEALRKIVRDYCNQDDPKVATLIARVNRPSFPSVTAGDAEVIVNSIM